MQIYLCRVVLLYFWLTSQFHVSNCFIIPHSPKNSFFGNSLSLKTGYCFLQCRGLNNQKLLSPEQEKNMFLKNNPTFYHYAASAFVPIIWGSYSPIIKWLYSSSSIESPSPLLFSLFTYSISFISLLLFRYSTFRNTENLEVVKTEHNLRIFSLPGLELGLWLFLGSNIQLIGISETSATRAAFLIQLTTLIVPLIESIKNKRSASPFTWLSCTIALLGVTCFSIDTKLPSFDVIFHSSFSMDFLQSFSFLNNFQFSSGDFLICLSAFFYSLHVVRLSDISKDYSSIDLSLSINLSKLALTITSFIVASFISGRNDSFEQVTDYLDKFYHQSSEYYPVLLILMWNGIVSTALTSWCQTFAQKKLSSSTANLIYSSQAIFAAAFASLFLDEKLSGNSLLGIELIAASVILSLCFSSEPKADVVDS